MCSEMALEPLLGRGHPHKADGAVQHMSELPEMLVQTVGDCQRRHSDGREAKPLESPIYLANGYEYDCGFAQRLRDGGRNPIEHRALLVQ